jgi:hypothetical protein
MINPLSRINATVSAAFATKHVYSFGRILALVFCIGLAFQDTSVQAQSYPVNFTGWYGYDAYHAFKEDEPWGLWIESYWIRQDVIMKQNALFARVGLNYYLKSGNRITGGFAYQYNYPYDAASKPYEWPDYRIFQQYLIRVHKPKGLWQFRFRLEERWLGRKTDPASNAFDHYQYETSLIAMIKKSFVINETFFAVLSEEIWLLFDTPERMLDQNRLYSGIGMNLDKSKEWHLELGYMYQPNFTGSPDTDEKSRVNHALRVTLTSDAPFKRK